MAAVNFSGPWNTFFRVRLSGGIDSSLEALNPGYGVRATFFRTFSRWWGQKKPLPDAGAEPPSDMPRPILPATNQESGAVGPVPETPR